MRKNKQLTDFTRTPLRHVFILLAALLFSMQAWADQGYAVLTPNEDNVVINGTTYTGKTLTFYYGTPTGTEGTDYFKTDDTPNNSRPGWRSDKNNSNDLTDQQITTVIFDESFTKARPTCCYAWFASMTNLTKIKNIYCLNTSEVTTMESMFAACHKLTSIDICCFNTSNLINTKNMFQACKELTTIYCDNDWSQNNGITSSDYMFLGCTNLDGYAADKLDKTYASPQGYFTPRHAMSILCKNGQNVNLVKTADISDYLNIEGEFDAYTLYFFKDKDPSEYTNIVGVYSSSDFMDMRNEDDKLEKCTYDERIKPTWIWSEIYPYPRDISFNITYRITKVVFEESFANARPTGCSCWFAHFENLKQIDGLEYLNTSNVKDMTSMFYKCHNLEALNLSNFDTSDVKSMYAMFYGCSGLSSLDLSSFDTGSVINMSYMFNGCEKLFSLTYTTEPNDENNNWFNTEKVKKMHDMFHTCSSLSTLDVSNFKTSNVVDMAGMFYGCSSLTGLNISGSDSDNSIWDTQNVTTMRNMFINCSSLTSLDVSNLNTGKVTDMEMMFRLCGQLKSLSFGPNFSTDKLTTSGQMFSYCPNLRYIDFYNSNHSTAIKSVDRNGDYQNMFYGVPSTTVIYLPKTSQDVTNVQNVVYSDNGDKTQLSCPHYYSADAGEYKARGIDGVLQTETVSHPDVELPRQFNAKEAVYVRTMPAGSTIGTAMLPYDFASNDSIQAYVLYTENETQMCFKSVDEVAHNTPFVFKVKKARTDGTAHFHMGDKNSANYNVTVYPTIGYDEDGKAEIDTNYFSTGYSYNGWTARGYYVQQMVDHDGAFYISRDGTKFCQADPQYQLLMYPHRITFHGSYAYGSSDAKVFDIKFMDLPTAIEEAEVRETAIKSQAIYDMQGRQQKGLQKGINIVRMNDGTVRKVISKK